MMRRSLLLLLFAVKLALVPVEPARAQPQAPEAASGRVEKAEARARSFMVAAAHPLAAEAGRAILQRGGTAIDAAVAVQMALTLVEPQSSGVGGGAFIVYWDAANQQVHSFDGRETAPAAARPDRFLKAGGVPMGFREAVSSGLSVGVPGAVAALEMAHARFGRLPWAESVAPAIRLAEQGFAVTPRLARLLALEQALRNDSAAQALYYQGTNTPLPVGTTLRNPALADTLRLIADKGAAGLMTGAMAEAIVAAVQMRGGDMTLADLAAYQPRLRPPLCGGVYQFRLCGMGPPSSGGIAVLQILMLLEKMQSGESSTSPVQPVHRFVEAGRLAFADRNLYVADPDFARVPLPGLLDPAYLAERARLILPDRAMGQAAPGTPPGLRGQAPGLWPQDGPPGTSHVSIIDRYGNGLSMTTTIEDAFGSRIMVGGFLLNNQLTDFSFVPEAEGRAVANRVEPGKRPRSSMAPTLVFHPNGELLAALGSPGGSQIINYVAQALHALLVRQISPQQAASEPHFGSRNGPTELESGSSPELAAALEAMGHRVQIMEMTSGLHIVMRSRAGLFLGGADPRREGVALGD